MPRTRRIRELKPFFMSYLHGEEPNYEPVLRDLLAYEQEVYDEMRKKDGNFARGERAEMTWRIVFDELTQILTPLQMEQFVHRLSQNFQTTCDLFLEMNKSQPLLEREFGTQD